MKQKHTNKLMRILLWFVGASVVFLAVVYIIACMGISDQPVQEAAEQTQVLEAETFAETAASILGSGEAPEEVMVPVESMEATEQTEPIMEETIPPTEPERAVLNWGAWYDSLGPGKYTRDEIAGITFVDSSAEAGEDVWDVSQGQNGKILAWTAPSVYAEGLRDLYISSDETIYSGESLSFRGFYRLQSLTFNGLLDTSEITNFAGMFESVGVLADALWQLDLSSWDVSGAVSMNAMFSGCRTLTALNLDGWDVSSVTNCADMFFGCKNLQHLDIANWQLAPGCVTLRMIDDCNSLTNAQELRDALNLTQQLTQEDFEDKLTELTAAELQWAAENATRDVPTVSSWPPVFEGDIAEYDSAYASMDLDGDGNTDKILHVPTQDEYTHSFELHMGSGQVLPLEISDSSMGCCYSEFLFTDMNASGQPDILAVNVHTSQGAGGKTVSFAAFTDVLGKYYKQNLQDLNFTMEDLHNNYVRLSCQSIGYREVIPLGFNPALQEAQRITTPAFQYYFGEQTEKTNSYRIQGVKVDGNRLIVLYNFCSMNTGYLSNNPFAAVWRLMPGGYFSIERIGTDVIRDYWLSP